MKFKQGDKVNKVGGNYQAPGIILSGFYTTQGAERYVFEFEDLTGMLHIFTPDQLELRNENDK